MILIGQYDSPFVRRVAIAMHHYGLPFERNVLSVFKDFEQILKLNPLGKVPSLVLDDGEILFESRAIIDFLEETVAVRKRLVPEKQPDRRRVLKIEVVGIGLAEKVYERGIEYSRRAPGTSDPAWRARLETQIASGCRWLECLSPSTWLYGDRFTRADLAVAVAVQYLERVLPDHGVLLECPKLLDHLQRCEALSAFSQVQDSRSEALASGWQPESK